MGWPKPAAKRDPRPHIDALFAVFTSRFGSVFDLLLLRSSSVFVEAHPTAGTVANFIG